MCALELERNARDLPEESLALGEDLSSRTG